MTSIVFGGTACRSGERIFGEDADLLIVAVVTDNGKTGAETSDDEPCTPRPELIHDTPDRRQPCRKVKP